MDYKLRAQTLSEWIALRINQVPIPICHTSIANIQSQVIRTAVETGIFTALIGQEKNLDTLAEECHLDSEVLQRVLQVLVSCKYLIERNDRYTITRKMRKFLSGTQSLQNYILLTESGLTTLPQLSDILRTGRAIDTHHTFKDPKHWQVYQAAMLEMARRPADIIKKYIPVKKDANLLLDIGGAHGLFGAKICQKHGIKRSLVLDLPQAIKYASRLARNENINGIVEFEAFDVSKQPLNIPCDVIFMSNFLHHFDEKQVQLLLKQAYHCLKTNGTIAIFSILNQDNTNNLVGAAMSLQFRLTSNSKCYSIIEHQNFLRDNGFGSIRSRRFLRIPSHQLTIAIKN